MGDAGWGSEVLDTVRECVGVWGAQGVGSSMSILWHSEVGVQGGWRRHRVVVACGAAGGTTPPLSWTACTHIDLAWSAPLSACMCVQVLEVWMQW